MKIFEISNAARYGLMHVFSHKLQSFLLVTILAIGVIVSALVNGFLSAASTELQSLSFGPYGRSVVIQNNFLIEHPYGFPTLMDAQKLNTILSDKLEGSAVWRFERAQVGYLEARAQVVVFGVAGDAHYEADIPLMRGRKLTQPDMLRANRVCVLGNHTASLLKLGDKLPSGSIQINGISCEVVGILEAAQSQVTTKFDKGIITPISAASRYFYEPGIMGPNEVSKITLILKSDRNLQTTIREADQALRKYRGIPQSHPSPFSYVDQSISLQVIARQKQILGTLLTIIAILSALAAMGGYMAASLSNMAGRKREMALHLSAGAKGASLFVQLLIESVLISSAAGILGVFAASSTGVLFEYLVGTHLEFDVMSLLILVLLGVLSGGVAGLGAAFQAAKSDPALVLRG